jgi:hypothetical protein
VFSRRVATFRQFFEDREPLAAETGIQTVEVPSQLTVAKKECIQAPLAALHLRPPLRDPCEAQDNQIIASVQKQ